MAYSDAPRCKATNREGQPCGQAAMKNGMCRIHGGKSIAGGVSNPNFTGTNNSHRMREVIADPQLLANYVEILNDPELLNLSSEIALMRAHSIQLIQRITTNGESAQRWERATDAYNRLVKATRDKARARQAQALRDLQIVFTERETDRVLWEEVHDTMRTLDRLVKAENKRRSQMHAMMSTEQTVGMIARLVGIIQEVVTDEATVRKIHKEFRSLIVENPALAAGINKVEGNKERKNKARFFAPGDLPESLEAMVLQE
jgi:flagellar motility protein MotE (MotC chaperone)